MRNRARRRTRPPLRGKILRLDVSKLPHGPGRAFRDQITPFDNPFVSRPDSNARLVVGTWPSQSVPHPSRPVRRWLVIGDLGGTRRARSWTCSCSDLPTPRPAQPEMGADYGWPFLEGSIPGRSPAAVALCPRTCRP
jgi:hypothetical protein